MQAQQQQPQTELPEWQRHLRERLLTGKGHVADALLSEIPAEDALIALRDILLPEALKQGKSLAIRNTLGLLMMLPLVASLFAWRLRNAIPLDFNDPKVYLSLGLPLAFLVTLWLFFDLKSHKLTQLWVKVYRVLPELIPRVQSSDGLSALIDFFGWFQTFGANPPVHAGMSSNTTEVTETHQKLKQATQRSMIRLLGRLSADEARALTANNRLVLLKLAQKAEDEVDMGIAALLALGTMGEVRVRPVAQKLTTSFLPRVREAAKECLQSI